MKRRALLLAGLLASTELGSVKAAQDVKVIYIGGWDCGPCSRWKTQYKAEWLASPEFRKVTWVEVDVPKLKEAYQDRYWQGELKPILDQIPKKTGTPRFLIVQGGQIISNDFGKEKWEHTFKRIQSLVG